VYSALSVCLMNECSVKFWLLQNSLKAGGTVRTENNILEDVNLEDLFSFQVFANIFLCGSIKLK